MNSVLHLVLANVMVAGLLAGVAWLVGRHSRRPALVHTLWLLVLVKLVTPPIIKLPVQWPSTNRAPETTTQKELPTPPRKLQSPDRVVLLALEPEPPQMLLAPAGASGSSMTFSFALCVATEVHTELATEATKERRQELPAEPRAESSPWPRLLLALWAAGSSGWLLCTVASLLAFCRLLRQALPAPPAIQAQADALARHMGLASAPPAALAGPEAVARCRGGLLRCLGGQRDCSARLCRGHSGNAGFPGRRADCAAPGS